MPTVASPDYLKNFDTKFNDLAIKKGMKNKEILGIMLRDDQLMQLLCNTQEDVRKIWKEVIGDKTDDDKDTQKEGE